eukprot:735343_1
MYQSQYISSKDIAIPLLELVNRAQPIQCNKRPWSAHPRLHHKNKSNIASNSFHIPTLSSHRKQTTKHFYNDKFIQSQTARVQYNKKQNIITQKHKRIQRTLRPKTATARNISKEYYYSHSLQKYLKLPSKKEQEGLDQMMRYLNQTNTQLKEKHNSQNINKRWYRRAQAKWRMKKRMREKLALDIKGGRIKSHHLLQAFDHQMMNWIGEEL